MSTPHIKTFKGIQQIDISWEGVGSESWTQNLIVNVVDYLKPSCVLET